MQNVPEQYRHFRTRFACSCSRSCIDRNFEFPLFIRDLSGKISTRTFRLERFLVRVILAACLSRSRWKSPITDNNTANSIASHFTERYLAELTSRIISDLAARHKMPSDRQNHWLLTIQITMQSLRFTFKYRILFTGKGKKKFRVVPRNTDDDLSQGARHVIPDIKQR